MKLKIVASVSVIALLMFAASGTASAKESTKTARKAPAPATTFVPSISVSEEYDDNIYTEDTNENGDWITRIEPNVVIKSRDDAHKFQFDAGAELAFYADDSNDNYFNYDAGVSDIYTISDTLLWDGSVDFRQRHSRRGDDDADPATNAKEPIAYTVFEANTSLTRKMGKTHVQPRLGYADYNYDDVLRLNNTVIDEDFRDRNEYMVGARIGYDVAPNFEAFTDLGYNPIDYDVSSATERTSTGGDYMAGVVAKFGTSVKGDFAAGYMNRDFDKNVYQNIESTTLSTKWTWSYKPGTTFKASVRRYMDEVTDANVGAKIKTDYRLTATKDLNDRLTGKIEGRYVNNDYQGGLGADGGLEDRQDDLYQGTLGISYKLIRKISLTAQYDYDNNSSNKATSEYVKNVIMFGVKAGF